MKKFSEYRTMLTLDYDYQHQLKEEEYCGFRFVLVETWDNVQILFCVDSEGVTRGFVDFGTGSREGFPFFGFEDHWEAPSEKWKWAETERIYYKFLRNEPKKIISIHNGLDGQWVDAFALADDQVQECLESIENDSSEESQAAKYYADGAATDRVWLQAYAEALPGGFVLG